MNTRITREALDLAQVGRFKDRMGRALSSVLDEAWDWAEEQGNTKLAKATQSAYEELTG